MALITIAQARARGVSLPADDTAAQDVIDEQEAWLARKIGALTGSRTETFYVGLSETRRKLGLRRPTTSVVVTDGGATVATDQYRLVDDGAAIARVYSAPTRWWTGPYVTAAYTPNDQTLVESALYDLCALAAAPATGYDSEQIGAYSYRKGSTSGSSVAAQRASIVSSLLPRRDQAVTLVSARILRNVDPVINRAEPLDEL